MVHFYRFFKIAIISFIFLMVISIHPDGKAHNLQNVLQMTLMTFPSHCNFEQLNLDLEIIYCSNHCNVVALHNEHRKWIKIIIIC